MTTRDAKPDGGKGRRAEDLIQVRTVQAIGKEWVTIGIEDYRRLAPALAAHEAEWISSGKLRECIARWLQGADFTEPAQREWERTQPELTAKEELLGMLREAIDYIGEVPSMKGADLSDRIRKRLEAEKL